TVASQQTLLVPDRLRRSEVEVADFLSRACAPGDVVLTRRESGLPLTALTTCRLALTGQFCLPPFVPVADILQRRQEQEVFWKGGAEGEVRADVRERYHVGSVLVDRAGGAAGEAPGRLTATEAIPAGGLSLQPCFENDGFAVYRVKRT